MPSLQLITNVKVEDRRAFARELSKFASEVLEKPESYMSVHVVYDEAMIFAGTFDPAFALTISSLDNIHHRANDIYSKAFFSFFKDKLNIAIDNGYIIFTDPGKEFWGYKETTFATMWSN